MRKTLAKIACTSSLHCVQNEKARKETRSMRRIHQIPFQAILQRREYAISQHAKLRVTNIGVYGLTLVMKVPQLARMTRGAFGIISFPIQMLPSSSATAAE